MEYTEQQLHERAIAGFSDELTEQGQEWLTIDGKHVMVGGHEPQSQKLGLQTLRSVALAHDDLKTKTREVKQHAHHNGKVVGHLAAAKALKDAKDFKHAHDLMKVMHDKAHAKAGSADSKSFHSGFKEALGHHISNVHAVMAAREQKSRRH